MQKAGLHSCRSGEERGEDETLEYPLLKLHACKEQPSSRHWIPLGGTVGSYHETFCCTRAPGLFCSPPSFW